MARNYIKLSNIINNYLLTLDEDDYGKYSNRNQLLTFGKECVRNHISQDLSGSVRSVKLTVNTELNTVTLSNDFLDWSKIGVLDGNCKVQVLGINNKINFAGEILLDNNGDALLDADGIELLSEKDCTPTTPSTGNIQDRFGGYFFNNYTDFHNGRLFGAGGGNNARGYFRFNQMDNRIELDSSYNWDNGIILEYVADESMASDPEVPTEAEDMVRRWLYYRTIERKMNVPENAKEMAKRNFINSKKHANFKRKMFSKQEAIQQLNKYFQLAPRFARQ